MNRASIIVPCWNQLKYTRLCVESVRAWTRYPYELVLIDNGSTDGTPAYLAEAAAGDDRVVVLRNPVNVGFPRACNQGARAASGAYLCFLNNDMEVSPGWLGRLVGAVEAGRFHLAGPRIIWRMMNDRFGRRRIPYIEGSCLLVRRAVFDALGGFDEAYSPAYWEDTDFGYAAFVNGFNMCEVPYLGLVHHGSKTALTQRTFSVSAVNERNGRTFYDKWARRPYRRILVVRLDSLGDVVMATAVMGGLRRAYPNAHLSLWTLPAARAVAEGSPYIDGCVLGDDAEAVAAARRLRPDVVINLQDHDRGRDLARQVGGDRTLGLDEPLMDQAFEARRERHRRRLHLVDLMGRMAGVQPGAPYVPVAETDREYVRALLGEAGIDDREVLVGVHLFGSAWRGKNWPLPAARHLVERLLGVCRVVVMGGGRFPEVPGLVDALNRTTVGQLAALLERCDCLVSNDTAPAHIAAALDTPTVVTFGPTAPEVSAPYRGQSVILRSRAPCAPCFRTDCDQPRCSCAADIDPDQVLDHVWPILDRACARPVPF